MVRSSLVVVLAAILTATAPAQVVYNPAADFSATNNPNGVWSYGWAGGPFTLDTSFHNSSALDFWGGPYTGGAGDELLPYVAHNGTNAAINYQGITYPPGQLGMFPGPGAESLVRWTAPTALSVLVSGSFYGLDPLATTNVHLYENGGLIFKGPVIGTSTVPFSLSISVLAGDHIAFGVDYGSDQDYSNDSTGLTATISTGVPEPTGLALLGMVPLAVAALRARRKVSSANSHPPP